MQCEAFEERLNAVLDERRRPEWDAELRAHTADCAVCRQLAASYQLLLDGFYELASPEPPADLALRVLEVRQQHAGRLRRRWFAVPALAAAAAIVFAFVPLAHNANDPPTAHRQRVQSPNSRGGASAAMALARFDKGPLPYLVMGPGAWSDAKDPYAGLAVGTGQNLAAFMLYVPGIAGTKGIIDAEGDASEGDSGWAGQMSEGFKPVSDSVAETINLILDSLPVTELASR
jgi:hypothetical protein